MWAGPTLAEEVPAAVPYRPGTANPAALSAPGWLEVELGVSRAREVEGATSRALSYALKLALSPDWGVRIEGDGLLRNAAGGVVTQGGGDTSIVLKRFIALNERSAFGLEAGLSLPTARTGLGSEGTDVLANGIFSSDLSADWHVDLNLAAKRFGSSTPGVGRLESTWAASVSRGFGSRWSLGAELADTRRSGNHSTSEWLISASYATSPSIVWDLGASRGMGSSSGGWTAFAGATFVVGRLF